MDDYTYETVSLNRTTCVWVGYVSEDLDEQFPCAKTAEYGQGWRGEWEPYCDDHASPEARVLFNLRANPDGEGWLAEVAVLAFERPKRHDTEGERA